MIPLDSSELSTARDRLLAGDVVAIPTETVYGLAASISSEPALRKIFSLKERPFFDPLIVHVASLKQARELSRDWPPLADYLARQFWPGPLTVVVPKSETVNPLITSGLDTVAIRYPAHPIAQDLIEMVGTPLAAPSANKFGRTSPSLAEHVRGEFQGVDLMIVDGGPCDVGVESTVIAFSKNDAGADVVQILRPGGITEEMLKERLEKWWPPALVEVATSQASPGHLDHHYMPKIPLIIANENGLSVEDLARLSSSLGSSFGGTAPLSPAELILSEDPAQAARELYSEMRRISTSGANLMIVRALPERQGGLWSAIWDRLKRAAQIDLRTQ